MNTVPKESPFRPSFKSKTNQRMIDQDSRSDCRAGNDGYRYRIHLQLGTGTTEEDVLYKLRSDSADGTKGPIINSRKNFSP